MEPVSFDKARELIHEFKEDRYVYGTGVLGEVGSLADELGQRAALVRPSFRESEELVQVVSRSLAEAGVDVLGEVRGAAPNSPREDLYRITGQLEELQPDVVVCLGGGSSIDTTKAAAVLRSLGGDIDDYFGTGLVTQRLRATGKTLTPLVAVQTAASSAAHLTKYANITDMATGQKKLIVDESIVPARALFDYAVTVSMPPALTADGAWDGLSHSLEVLYGAVGKSYYDKAAEVAKATVELVLGYVERAVTIPADVEARTALGLATDLGGYAIMLGGTNGAHLTSFSLVDILSHGRACGVMNPYFTVFFAPAIEGPLHMVAQLFRDAGIAEADIEGLTGRRLGVAVAEAMMGLSQRLGYPTTLGEVEGFSEEHVQRALSAAKDPQLRMKLENMPVPLTAEMVDVYLGSVLEAAREGDPSLVRNVK
jgi:alcohol dehydrogenase